MDEATAEGLADLMMDDNDESYVASGVSSQENENGACGSSAPSSTKVKTQSKRERRQRLREARRKVQEREARERETRQKELWKMLEIHKTFQITQAAPINTYNVPMARPYFIGYFADVKTLLHNCKGIVPLKVDIIVNPASPLEMVLNRSATDQVLSGENLVQQAYHRVERAIQSELHVFFAVHCPEVLAARSICYPQPSPEGSNPEDVIYDTIVLIDTLGNPAACASKDTAPMLREMQAHAARNTDPDGNGNENNPPPPNPVFDRVMSRVAEGKHSGLLLGHYSLSVIPFEAGDVFLQDGSSLFYTKSTYSERRQLDEEFIRTTTSGGGSNQATASGGLRWSSNVKPLNSDFIASPSQSPNPKPAPPPRSLRMAQGVMVRKGRAVVSSRSGGSQLHRDSIYVDDPTMSHTEAHSITSQLFRTGQGAIK